jgi:hypothetical protein
MRRGNIKNEDFMKNKISKVDDGKELNICLCRLPPWGKENAYHDACR